MCQSVRYKRSINSSSCIFRYYKVIVVLAESQLVLVQHPDTGTKTRLSTNASDETKKITTIPPPEYLQ